MTVLMLTIWGSGMVIVARWLCGRWFNHLSLYSIVWSVSLIALSLNLIHYNHIVPEAWLFIFLAWIAIYFGTAIVKLGKWAPQLRSFPELHMRRLRNAILLLSVAGLASSAVLASNIVLALGTDGLFVALTEYANQIYGMRFAGEVSGLMYLNFLPYAGCVLAGIYTARLGRLTFVALLPLMAMLADGIVSMQRAAMVFGSFLLLSGYLMTPKVSKLRISKWQKLAFAFAFLAAFLGVTVQRGGAAYIEGETQTLVNMGERVSALPALYFYASGPIPCFSEYLQHAESDGKALWGRYMFASIYRLLSKFGLDTYVSYYQNFYYTPAAINVGTYLRELHRDFGATAIFIFPFLLGVIISAIERCAPTPQTVIVLSFLYLVVFFSSDENFIGGGGWYFPLPIALLVAAKVKVRQGRQKEYRSTAHAVPT